MCQTSLTRRQLLRQAALLGATAPVLAAVSPLRSLAEALEAHRPGPSGPAVPMHLELVTVTDTRAQSPGRSSRAIGPRMASAGARAAGTVT